MFEQIDRRIVLSKRSLTLEIKIVSYLKINRMFKKRFGFRSLEHKFFNFNQFNETVFKYLANLLSNAN